MTATTVVYRPRNPQASDYYRCVQDHFEAFLQVYEERFERQYGFFRCYIQKVIYRYLDCGDLHNGFARVKLVLDLIGDAKTADTSTCLRSPASAAIFVPPAIRSGWWNSGNGSVPKCSKMSPTVILSSAYRRSCAAIAIQTFGDFLGFSPHCHILVTDGCFYGSRGMFRVAPPLELKKLETIFRHKVFRMLLAKGKVSREMIAILSNWRHSGFNVFCGNRISPHDATAMENLAR